MRIVSVVGARPQFVKLAPIDKAFQSGDEHLIIHTGQHYDAAMSDVFFDGLEIAAPTHNLGVGSGPHGRQTATMLAGLEESFEELDPDAVLVYGDTNSTLAAALAAVKMHLPLAHLEAGLRSFNRRMPEEHNRVLTDHASDLCLAPTQSAMGHLAHEGLADRSVQVGDVMTDVLLATRDSVLAGQSLPLPVGLEDAGFYVATIHRPDNTDRMDRLAKILHELGRLDAPVLLLAHPRFTARLRSFGLDKFSSGSVILHPPMSYRDLVSSVMRSRGVITDSGGLQKEAFLLKIPCTTIRAETEWVETVELGWNVLVDENLGELGAIVSRPWPDEIPAESPYGDGRAAQRVLLALRHLTGGLRESGME